MCYMFHARLPARQVTRYAISSLLNKIKIADGCLFVFIFKVYKPTFAAFKLNSHPLFVFPIRVISIYSHLFALC